MRPQIPEAGDRVADFDTNHEGTAIGLRSGDLIAVRWDKPHPFQDDVTLACFEDIYVQAEPDIDEVLGEYRLRRGFGGSA